MTSTASVAAAKRLAGELLVDVGERLAHTQGVAAAGARAARAFPASDGATLLCACWLHDIGYSPSCVRTGLHGLDGAMELVEREWPTRVAALVAHHSMAGHEADARVLRGELAGFEREIGPIADALVWADMTTDHRGGRTSVEQRINSIMVRYPEDHPVHTAVEKAATELVDAVRRTEELLEAVGR